MEEPRISGCPLSYELPKPYEQLLAAQRGILSVISHSTSGPASGVEN